MLRMRPIADAKSAGSYYGRTDGGQSYYLGSPEMHREVGGYGAKLLGLDTAPDIEQFKRLLNGFDPNTGEQLTAKLIEGRLAGWDVTASIPKGVTVAMEAGDERVHDALWQAGRETMADLESFTTTRVQKGGIKEGERITGNMIYYGFEHPETRPAKQDGMPDPDRHIHFVIPNVTWDKDEQQWKAIKFRPVMDLRKWFDRRFDQRLARKLTELGYEVETKFKQGKYYSWDIKDMPASVIKKFSRRTQEVEKLAEELGVVNPTVKDKLGATSRMFKRKDMTLDDYREYWRGRLTEKERDELRKVLKAAIAGKNPQPENTADKAVEYAIEHEFYRNSVVSMTDLEITAMERSVGGALPEEIRPECKKQGVLTKEGEATTKEVLAQEGRIIAFARESRGTMRPLASRQFEDARRALAATFGKNVTLSPEQQAAIHHIWNSPDQVILIRGGAGTGKTTMMKTAIAGIDKPVAVLAPSAEASRGVLRREGFDNANTVAAFLGDEQWQKEMKSGAIWVDEAGLLPVADLDRLCGMAKALDARLILQGDPKQHKSVARHGNMFPVLQQYARLPLAELKDIKRQKGQYKEAVAAIQNGDILKGHDILAELGCVRQVEGNREVVDDYLAAIKAGKSALIVAPTHAQGDDITQGIRGD